MNTAWATVETVLSSRPGLCRAHCRLDNGREGDAVGYVALSGAVEAGDRVLLNTTAVDLGLGTGGVHFIVANVSRPARRTEAAGHIMKLRYTPLQVPVLTVEEPDAPTHAAMRAAATLDGIPVVCCGLLSQVPAVLAGLLHHRPAHLALVMTDEAALPAAFSDLLAHLRASGAVAGIITAGQAFGGDLEAVNVYSALLAARHVLGAEAVIVSPGPGTVGTDTPWGFGGVAQGEALNAAHVLGGRPIAAVRASEGDGRARHRGISHHTRTVLSRVCLGRVWVGWPADEAPAWAEARASLSAIAPGRVTVCDEPGTDAALDAWAAGQTPWNTMGRNRTDDPVFFRMAAAAGRLAARLLENRSETPGTGKDGNALGENKETLVSREAVYEGKTLTVCKDTVRLPNGKEATREAVHHRGSVAIVAVHGGQVYFVRQYRHVTGETLLELPAGSLEPDEEPEACARREIQEEIGHAAGKMTFLFEGYVSPGYTNELQRVFLAEDLSPAQAEADADEFLAVETLPWPDALAAVDAGAFRDTKTVAGLLAAARRLGIR